MKRWFNFCWRFRDRLSLLASGDLPESERRLIQRHLAGCPACATRYQDLRRLVIKLEKTGEALPEMEATKELSQRWMAAVRASTPASAIKPSLDHGWLAALAGRRMAWGSLAAVWLLTLFFRWSAPAVSSTGAGEPAPATSEIVAVLKADFRSWTPTASAPKTPPKGQSLPPRSERMRYISHG